MLSHLFNFSRENIRFSEITLFYLAFDAGGAADTVSGATAGDQGFFVCVRAVLHLCAPPA
jgi:hypothetical protein